MTDQLARDPRFQRGLDVYDVMTGNAFGNELSPGLAELGRTYPFLVDVTMSFAIGEVWGRSEIDHKSREFAMIAALGAMGDSVAVQMKQHIDYAFILGATADELRELVYLTMVTAGFPRALNMATEMKAVFDAKGVGAAAVEPASPDADRLAKGMAKLSELDQQPVTDITSHRILGPLAKDFPCLAECTLTFALADVWSRPGLNAHLRQISAVAALGAIGHWSQMRIHVGHALRAGVSQAMLKEIIYLLIIAAGFPIAINASNEMSKVFVEHKQ